MIWVTYLIKLAVGVADTPLVYLLVWKLKNVPNKELDAIDGGIRG